MNGDIQVYDEAVFGQSGTKVYQVATGSASYPAINPGEPVAFVLGQQYVTALATNLPTSGAQANTILGISASTSTESGSAAGTVEVITHVPGMTYLIKAKVPATFGYNTTTGVITQATYNALVGYRVVIDLTGTAAAKTATYTALAADNAAYGCVIEPLDITKYPGFVRFSIRPAATSLGWATGIS